MPIDEKVWCPTCKTGREYGDAFCHQCGHPLTERPNCECGKKIFSHYAFCPGCGKPAQVSA